MNPTATPTKREVLQNKLDSGQSIFRGGVKPPEIYGNTPTISPTTANIDTTVPNVIPAKALSGNVSYSDLRLKRNNLEQQNLISQTNTQNYNDLLRRANAPLTGSPITNPDAYINELLLNRPTQTQTQLDTLGSEQARQTRGFAGELTSTQEKANKQFGVSEAQTSLAETQSRIADRTVQLRQALRDFEINAEQRGVAREFVESAKGKIQADAAAELADLSIIENAQLGNLQQAQAEVDRVIENKKQSFLFENQAIQQEIDNLNKKDDRESKSRAEQLQIALDTRKQNIETQLANEKEQRGYMAEAAANGADTATLDAIRNAKSPQEALFVAGDFIGKLDREAKLANIAQSYSSIRTNELQQAKLLAELNADNTGNSGDLVAYAQQFAETGKLPSVSELKQSGLNVSQVTEYAKQAPKPDGAILSISTGIKPTTLSDEQEKGITAMNEIVSKTIPTLKDRFGKINTGLIGGLSGLIYTSQDRQDYNTFRQEFLSKLLVARSGAAVTEQEYNRYAKMLPSEFNQMFFLGADGMKKLNALEDSMKINLNNTLNSTQTAIQGYSKVNIPSLGEKKVGEIIDIGGEQYRVLPDGTLTDII